MWAWRACWHISRLPGILGSVTPAGRLTGHPPTVSVLHAEVLDRLHGLVVRFLPDAVAAEQAVRSESASTAFLLPPTKVERVWRLVDDGRKLPQKSTYFWPKPRTGLVIRPMALAPS